jgi:gluconate 5-dehydrogenase
MKMFSLEGKIALVTGATHGIGLEMAVTLARAGAKIIFNDLSKDALERGSKAYIDAGIEAYGYLCDVTDEPSVVKMIEQI